MNFFLSLYRKYIYKTYFIMEGLRIFTGVIISVETLEDCENDYERDDKEEQANADISAERMSIISLNSKLFGRILIYYMNLVTRNFKRFTP